MLCNDDELASVSFHGSSSKSLLRVVNLGVPTRTQVVFVEVHVMIEPFQRDVNLYSPSFEAARLIMPQQRCEYISLRSTLCVRRFHRRSELTAISAFILHVTAPILAPAYFLCALWERLLVQMAAPFISVEIVL